MEREMRRITDLDRVKQIEIEILDYTVSICEKHNLKYSLAYGTLLGAVRHKGFIPWDDDIDIIMPRGDYDKLVSIWEKDSRYKLLDCRKDKDYIYPFMKVVDTMTRIEEHEVTVDGDLGIYIDIFAIDLLPENEEERKRILRKCALLEKMRIYSMLSYERFRHSDWKKNIGRKLLWRVLKCIGPARLSRKIESTISKNRVLASKYQGMMCTGVPEQEVLSCEIWEDLTKVEFEGKQYCAPVNYDEILTTNYGDYMTLPPVEQRVLKHNFKAWEYYERSN